MASIDLCNECPSNYSERMEGTVIYPYTGLITCSVHLYPVLHCIKSFCVASSVSLIRRYRINNITISFGLQSKRNLKKFLLHHIRSLFLPKLRIIIPFIIKIPEIDVLLNLKKKH